MVLLDTRYDGALVVSADRSDVDCYVQLVGRRHLVSQFDHLLLFLERTHRPIHSYFSFACRFVQHNIQTVNPSPPHSLLRFIGVCKMFEVHLKQMFPQQKHINYDIADLFAYIDALDDLTCLVFHAGMAM